MEAHAAGAPRLGPETPSVLAEVGAGVPENGAGPGAEVCWLSGNQRLMTLRYRTPPYRLGLVAVEVALWVAALRALARRRRRAPRTVGE